MPFPILTAAWWLARVAGVREGAARFWNGASAKAIAVAVVAVAVLIGGVLFWFAARNGVAAERDALWKRNIALSNAKVREVEMARDRRAAAAADAERAAIAAERDAMRERAADLERALAALDRTDTADPVVIPKDLARSLRR